MGATITTNIFDGNFDDDADTVPRFPPSPPRKRPCLDDNRKDHDPTARGSHDPPPAALAVPAPPVGVAAPAELSVPAAPAPELLPVPADGSYKEAPRKAHPKIPGISMTSMTPQKFPGFSRGLMSSKCPVSTTFFGGPQKFPGLSMTSMTFCVSLETFAKKKEQLIDEMSMKFRRQ